MSANSANQTIGVPSTFRGGNMSRRSDTHASGRPPLHAGPVLARRHIALSGHRTHNNASSQPGGQKPSLKDAHHHPLIAQGQMVHVSESLADIIDDVGGRLFMAASIPQSPQTGDEQVRFPTSSDATCALNQQKRNNVMFQTFESKSVGQMFNLTKDSQLQMGEAVREMCSGTTHNIRAVVRNFSICVSAVTEYFIEPNSQVLNSTVNALVECFCHLLQRAFPHNKEDEPCPLPYEVILRFLSLVHTAKIKGILLPYHIRTTTVTIVNLIGIISRQYSSSSSCGTSQVRVSIIDSLIQLPDSVAQLAEHFSHLPPDFFQDTKLVSVTIQLAYHQIVRDVLLKGWTLHGYIQNGGSYKRSKHQATEQSILRLLKLGSSSCLADNAHHIRDLSRLGFSNIIKCLPNNVFLASTKRTSCAASDTLHDVTGDVCTVLGRIITDTPAVDIDKQITHALNAFSPDSVLPIFTLHLREQIRGCEPITEFELKSVGKLYALYRVGVAVGDAVARSSSISTLVVSECVGALERISLLFAEMGTKLSISICRGTLSSPSVIEPTIKLSHTINSIRRTHPQ